MKKRRNKLFTKIDPSDSVRIGNIAQAFDIWDSGEGTGLNGEPVYVEIVLGGVCLKFIKDDPAKYDCIEYSKDGQRRREFTEGIGK